MRGPLCDAFRGGFGVFALGLFAGAAACEGEPGLAPGPGLRFEPSRVELARSPLDETTTARVALSNPGPAAVRILEVRYEPERPELQLAPVDAGATLVGLSIPPSGRVPLEVRYAPSAPADHGARVVLDTDRETAVLEVGASAARVEAEQIEVEPAALDFGEVIVGEAVDHALRLTHRGEVATRIVGFEAPVEELGLDLDGAPLALPSRRIEPGAALDLTAWLAPSSPGPVDTALQLELPDRVAISVPIAADVSPAGISSCPEAVDFGAVPRGEAVQSQLACFSSAGAVRVREVSLDPTGASGFEIVRWSSTFDRLDVELRYLALGLSGSRAGAIRIETTTLDPMRVVLRAETSPPAPGSAAVSARLGWSGSGVDLDLHFVRLGAEPFTPGEDCYWADKNPAWGDPTDPLDDPFLDRDATDDAEPEEVNLIAAEEARYDLYVQYHDYVAGLGDDPVEATIDLTLRGQPAQRRVRRLPGCGSFWHVARVEQGRLEWIDDVDERYRSLADPKCR